MRKKNPILKAALKTARPPSMGMVWVIAGAITLLLSVLLIRLYQSDPLIERAFTRITVNTLLFGAGSAGLLAPLAVGPLIAVSTARQVGGEAFQLLRVTGLDASAIFKGYRNVAYFRLRTLWGAAAALFAPVIIAADHFGVGILYNLYCYQGSLSPAGPCPLPTMTDFTRVLPAAFLLTTLVTALALIVNLYAVSVGISAAFLTRSETGALGLTFGLVLIPYLSFAGLGIRATSFVDGPRAWALLFVGLLAMGAIGVRLPAMARRRIEEA
jgi:hypothetical protein